MPEDGDKGSDEEYRDMRKLVICVSGLSGSGKSTLARGLAKRLGLKYVSGGNLLKELARELGFNVDRRGWWESDEGIKFIEMRRRSHDMDREVDERLKGIAREGGVVIDSWTIPWLIDLGIKIWLEVPKKVRALRISRRDGISYEEALKRVNEKDGRTKSLYEELYGFKLGEDLSPFHIILDTSLIGKEEALNLTCELIRRLSAKA